MNALETRLNQLDSGLFSAFKETKKVVELLLGKYNTNFPTYTDHSIKHSLEVLELSSQLLTKNEIDNLNSDELYILSMACILHDIGMCLPKDKLETISIESYEKFHDINIKDITENMIREIHHELSYYFIKKEFENLKIPNDKYAVAIALVARGHRKVSLDDIEIYPTKFFVKNGRDFVCLPYLASVVRLADELDITNIRTPNLLTKYYMPNNEVSIKEWNKHISTTQINFTEDKVIFEVKCSDQNNLAALEEQFEKIQNAATYCQKIVRNISNTEDRVFKLNTIKITPKFTFFGFDPKGIKFSFNVQNVVKTFIGEDLYDNKLVAIRETLQNSIDSCRYRKGVFENKFDPLIIVNIEDDYIQFIDNGLGMDEFVIENFFGKLGSSFYEQEKIKKNFEAIGQFGIGVFSYFLIAEYIDIETKTHNTNTLKFRLDKDPKNYFHFFDHTERTDTGTTITLYLKPEIKSQFKYENYVSYIRKTFKHVEFSIKIISQNEAINIESTPYPLNYSREIEKRIRLDKKIEVKNYKVMPFSFSNDDFEGECAIIVPNLTKKLSLKDVYRCFDYESFPVQGGTDNQSQISISQKGVFINWFSSELLNLVIGQINLKKSHKINLSRDNFTDQKAISRIIDYINAGLIEKVFNAFKTIYTDKQIYRLSDEFIRSYLSPYYEKDICFEKYSTACYKWIFVKIILNKKEQIISLGELCNSFNQFVYLSDQENINRVLEFTDLPVVIASGYESNDGSYYHLREVLIHIAKFGIRIILNNDVANQVFDKNFYQKFITDNSLLEDVMDFSIKEISEIESDYVAIQLVKNKPELNKYDVYYGELIINCLHPYIDFIRNNIDIINKDSEYVKIVKSSISIISNIYDSKQVTDSNLTNLNTIIQPFKKIAPPWVFTKSDFQI